MEINEENDDGWGSPSALWGLFDAPPIGTPPRLDALVDRLVATSSHSSSADKNHHQKSGGQTNIGQQQRVEFVSHRGLATPKSVEKVESPTTKNNQEDDGRGLSLKNMAFEVFD